MTALVVHAPCTCCGASLCWNAVLEVWVHEQRPTDQHLPQPKEKP